MSSPILATKLYSPLPKPGAVRRPHLVERIEKGQHCRLTLISAPAGFGKTTLVSEWVACCKRSVAWLSLDEGDNDLSRFLTYFIAALQTIKKNLGEGVLGVLQTPQPPPVDSVLTALINEISTLPEKITIILDDYHVIDSKSIDKALTFLLTHLPSQVNLIIATREDPHLPQARLRARGQLNELRAADLRFSAPEAADFINRVMGLNLSEENIATLETRTEGWIAGLQLAALSMQGHENIAGFIKSFTGSHRFVMDYLVEEVLQKQSPSVKQFLLFTSILDRLCGPLCDAVLLAPSVSGQKTLEYMEHANLFIVPLDHERRWYRYHHLFAELLRQRLHQNLASSTGKNDLQVADLHKRASRWYADNNLQSKAIRHAFAAKDFKQAADLVELVWAEMDQSYQTDTWLGWVKLLPEDLVRARPVLGVGYAWALLDKGEVDAVEPLLNDAERWIGVSTERSGPLQDPSTPVVVVDQKQFLSLPASIADARATRALMLGNVTDTLKYARLALDIVPQDDHFRRGAITGTLGLTYWTCGDLEAAFQYLSDSMASMQKAGIIHLALGITSILAEIRLVQGRLREVVSAYESSLKILARPDKSVSLAAADLYLGLSVLNCEQGGMTAAMQHLKESKELAQLAAFPAWQYRWYLAQARLKETQGEPDAALNLLMRAEHLNFAPFLPDIRPLAAFKAQVWLRQGKAIKSLDWAREQGVSVDDELCFMHEYEHITLARVLIAEYKRSGCEGLIVEAIGLLERLEKAAENGGRMGSLIEILVVHALAYAAQDNISLALTPFTRALALAEPEGYVRIFVVEGIEMTRLLSEAAARRIAPDYTNGLLAAIKSEKQISEDKSCLSPAPPAQVLVEPLSKRELEVLRLIAQGLSNREIGERLFVALDTVKGHNRNIFGKLQVQRRTEAVARAQKLNLL